MPPKRGGRRGTVEPEGRGHRGTIELEGRIDRIKRILEELVQVVQDTHNNTTNAPEPPVVLVQRAVPVPRAEVVGRTTIKKFQQLKPLTFQGTPNPMAKKSQLLGIERVFEVLPCTDEHKMTFVTFTFEGAALVWWQLKKLLEPLWLWPRFLEVFNEEYFSETVED